MPNDWTRPDPATVSIPQGVPIPKGAVGPFFVWNKQGVEWVDGGSLAGRERTLVVDPAYEDPDDYVKAVRDLTEQRLLMIDAGSPDFRWREVRVIPHGPGSPGTRLAVIFSRDDEPDVTYGFWFFIWEAVTWVQVHERPRSSIRYQPGRLANNFVFYMLHDLGGLRRQPGLLGPDGIRWVRLNLVW
jgi:hypothetical protein